MNLALHLTLLFLQLLSDRNQLFITKLFLAQMISHNSIGLSKLVMLKSQNLNSFIELIDFKFNVGVLLRILSVMVVSIPELSLQVV